jgi:hypothetical protein
MPIDSKECFAALTEDGQLWEIYQAAQSGGGGGGAPTNASYVVMSNDPTLTDERVLTQGTNITITDGGANNPVTVATVADPVFDLVEFDSTYTGGVSQYQMAWNDADGTVEIGLKGGNVDLSIGQEEVVLAKNDDTIALNPGTAVYVSGADGTNILVKRAKADADATSVTTIGLVAETLTHPNGKGFITTFGVIKNINTTGSPYGETWAAGDVIYLSPTISGGLTNIKPSAPQHLVQIGFVVKTSAGNGEIFVEVQNGYELEELHNVQINSGTLANNDLLAYNLATQTWQNKTAASSGLVTSVGATAPITSSGGATPNISTSIATNKVVGRSTAGTGVMEELTPVGITVSAGNITGIGGTVGTVDNAVPRADGTGGYTVQPSGLIVEDAIVSVTGITGDAGTEIITAPGTAFVSGQPIRFTALTGGAGLNTTTNYFVVNPSGATFQVETSIGGGAINFTTNITAGTLLTGHSVSTNVTLSENTTATNSDLVLTPKGTGAFILGPKPDGTTTGGNARGARAVDFQLSRGSAAQVASGPTSFIAGSDTCTASGNYSAVISSQSSSATNNYSVCIASNNSSATAISSIILGGGYNNATAQPSVVIVGESSLAQGNHSAVIGRESTAATSHSIAKGFRASSDRFSMLAHAGGQFSARGDAQRARFVLRNKTTTNAAVELFLDGSATRLTIPSGKYLTGTINIAGIKSDGATAARYIRQFSIKNVAATTSLVGNVDTIGVDQAASTSISITADDTNDSLKVEVTGIASETWRWVAAVDVVEVAYGT